MRISLKLALVAVVVLLLFVAVYAGDYFWSDAIDKSNHGVQTLVADGYGGVGKQIKGTLADTTSQVKAYSFLYFVTATKVTTDGTCDSARTSTYLQKSLNGSDWVTIDSVQRAGKSDDTLYAEKLWYLGGGTTVIYPTMYLRWINACYNADTTSSAFVYQKHLFQQ